MQCRICTPLSLLTLEADLWRVWINPNPGAQSTRKLLRALITNGHAPATMHGVHRPYQALEGLPIFALFFVSMKRSEVLAILHSLLGLSLGSLYLAPNPNHQIHLLANAGK
jgi:hypothetical protein